jgi:hypothetical protein
LEKNPTTARTGLITDGSEQVEEQMKIRMKMMDGTCSLRRIGLPYFNEML